MSLHGTTRTATRRTRAVGKEGEPGYIPSGEVTTETVERNLYVHRKGLPRHPIRPFLDRLDRAPTPAQDGLRTAGDREAAARRGPTGAGRRQGEAGPGRAFRRRWR